MDRRWAPTLGEGARPGFMIIPPGSKIGAAQAAALGAIRVRAGASGVDAGFLETLATVESGLRSDLRARTSTAAGLFQFIEATWLDLLHRHGAKHGLAADAPVSVDPAKKGAARFHFASEEQRQAALDLRFDPSVATALAAEYVLENRTRLADMLARSPQAADLYMMHFLGPGDARRFFHELERAPDADASRLFSAPAAANRGVFFTRDGSPRSLRAIYDLFASRFPETPITPGTAGSVETRAPDLAVPEHGPVGSPLYGPGGRVPDWRAAAIALLTVRLDWPEDVD